MVTIPAVDALPVCAAGRQVIDGRIAVDIMRDVIMVEAPPQLYEIKKFGYLGPDG
jgi:hypothetical protein